MSSNLELIICMQDRHSRIARIEYQDETRYTGVLGCKPYIDTFNHIGH